MTRFIVLIVLAWVLVSVVNAFFEAPIDLGNTLIPPSWGQPFGTDHLGRDVLLLTGVGVLNSLFIGVIVRSAALFIGVIYGTTAGYFGGRVDNALMRFVDVMMAFPDLLLAIGFSVAFGNQSMISLIAILTIVSWPSIARLARSKTLVIKNHEFVSAAVALGASSVYIIGRHIISQTWDSIRLLFALGIGAAIMGEASLSFLGLGVPGLVTLGGQIQGGFPYLLSAPWIALFPAAVLGVVVFFCLNSTTS